MVSGIPGIGSLSDHVIKSPHGPQWENFKRPFLKRPLIQIGSEQKCQPVEAERKSGCQTFRVQVIQECRLIPFHVIIQPMATNRKTQETTVQSSSNADRQVRYLKETISALRDRLETYQFEKNKAVQAAVAASSGEIEQLKTTTQALRDTLEELNFQRNKDVQQTRADSQDEIEQLRKTIQAMRDETESVRFEGDKKTQKAVATASDEIRQLRETVQSLRDEMESERFEGQQKVQKTFADSSNEIKLLKDSVSALRDQLDVLRTGHEDKLSG